MVNLMYCLTIFLYFDVPLLYYYINHISLIIIYLFSGDIYLSFGISISNLVFFVLASTVSGLFCGKLLVTFVILSAISLPIKLPNDSAFLSIAHLDAVLSRSVAKFFT